MNDLLDLSTSNPEFRSKPPALRKRINEALLIIEAFGTPVQGMTPRKKERMAMCFMSLAGMTKTSKWKNAKDISNNISMKSRDIISYVNTHFGERISPGSYDDIRRQDLKLLVLSGIVSRTKPSSNRNDPSRGYAVSEIHGPVIRSYASQNWNKSLSKFMLCCIIVRPSG